MYQTISFRFMVASSKIGKDGTAPLYDTPQQQDIKLR